LELSTIFFFFFFLFFVLFFFFLIFILLHDIGCQEQTQCLSLFCDVKEKGDAGIKDGGSDQNSKHLLKNAANSSFPLCL